tara:strand:+ start:765 stop:980 length:216 start_codon:yes stop_codon:yes gene_type:complete
MSDKITLLFNNNIYIIEKEPFETLNETYARGWYIVKNYDKIDYKLLNSYSIINNNINTYNMNYEIKLPLLK